MQGLGMGRSCSLLCGDLTRRLGVYQDTCDAEDICSYGKLSPCAQKPIWNAARVSN